MHGTAQRPKTGTRQSYGRVPTSAYMRLGPRMGNAARLHLTSWRDSRPCMHCTHPPYGRYGTSDAGRVSHCTKGIGDRYNGGRREPNGRTAWGDSNAFKRSPWRYVRATIDHRIMLFTNVSGRSGSERRERVIDADTAKSSPSQTRSDAGTRPTANSPPRVLALDLKHDLDPPPCACSGRRFRDHEAWPGTGKDLTRIDKESHQSVTVPWTHSFAMVVVDLNRATLSTMMRCCRLGRGEGYFFERTWLD